MSDPIQPLHRGVKIGDIYVDEETLILDFDNKQYQLPMSFFDIITEHSDVTIDKGKYR